MALFESGPKKILKKLRKYAEEGSINKVSSTVKEEKNVLLEESSVALELVELLLDIGHPNLAASVGEEVMRRHRQIAREVRNLFIGRMNEFSRSTELLRVTWQSFIDMHDFRGALNVLRQAEEITVNSLFDQVGEKMQSSMRFDGTVHPEADQEALVEWALHLYREHRSGEAIDFLWKVCREVEFPSRDVPLLAFWIGNQIKGLDSIFLISLMGIAAVSGKMDQALMFASKLSDSEPSPDEATDAANVIEKYMVPADRSGKSSALLAEMYTAAGKTEAASKTLESIYGDSLDREELEEAIDDLVAHPESGAAPLLLSAQMHLEKNRIEEATEMVERAFDAGGAESQKLITVCRTLIDATGDRTGNIALKLADYLVDSGQVEDAVFALIPIVDVDPSWVFEQVQKLISRERNNASVLSLLAAVLFEAGKRDKASATLEHLSRRTDKKFCSDSAAVLDAMETQIQKYSDLLETRALFRYRSEREQDAAEDWFRLLLQGKTPSQDGKKLLERDDIVVGSVSQIVDSGFKPSTPWQAFIAALICFRESNMEQANAYLGQAMENPDLQRSIISKIEKLPEDMMNQLDLRSILTRVAEGDAAEGVASILDKISGQEDWKIALATSLKWNKPGEEAQFKFRYLLSRNRVVLAGSSFVRGSIGEPLIESVAEACAATVRDDYEAALEHLEKPVRRPWSSPMARKVLEFILSKSPAFGTRIRMLIAQSYRTEKKFDDVSAILDPVLEEEGVLGLMEEMMEENPGEYPLARSLARTSAQIGDFDRFQKYSAVMLDISTDAVEELVDLASNLASGSSSGRAYLYAARLASRYGVAAETDNLLTQALLLVPELAGEGILKEFHRMGPVPRALCSLSEGGAREFSMLCAENPEMELPLNEEMIENAYSRWSPENDGEALYMLAEQAFSKDFTDIGEKIICSLSSSAPEPLRTRAARKLLEEAKAGRVNRIKFWESVRSGIVIAEAMESLLPDNYGGVDREELRVIAPVVLKSGQGIRRLFQLADDSVLFPESDVGLRKRLAESCLNHLHQMPEDDRLSESETEKLLEILLSAGMLSEAVSIARGNGSNSILAKLRTGLVEAREKLEEEGVRKAHNLNLSGKPEDALEVIDGLDEESPESLDEKALALWNLGYRDQAIRIWMRAFSDTSDSRPLRRLFWALDQSGAYVEKAALKRHIAQKYPGLSRMLSGQGQTDDSRRLELISGLPLSVKAKKVKNG